MPGPFMWTQNKEKHLISCSMLSVGCVCLSDVCHNNYVQVFSYNEVKYKNTGYNRPWNDSIIVICVSQPFAQKHVKDINLK